MEEKITNTISSAAGRVKPFSAGRFRLFLYISVYFSLFTIVHGYSQSDSLYSYLEIAAKKNPAIQQKFSEYQAALQKVPQVGSLSDPEFSLGVFLQPMELVNGNQVAEMRIMQMFPWFGVIRHAKDEMSLMANAKYELLRDARLQLFYDVERTWYELNKVQKAITISEKNLEILKIIERLALGRFRAAPAGDAGSPASGSGMPPANPQNNNAGSLSAMQTMAGNQGNQGSAASGQSVSGPQTGSMSSSSGITDLAGLYQIQIETGDLENSIGQLKDQEQSVKALFNSYINRPSFSPVSTGEILAVDTLGISLLSVSDSIIAQNPMLSMIGFEKQSLEARKKMVTAMGYPMVGLGLNYSLIGRNAMSASPMNGRDMIMPMLTVTLPVYRKKYNAMQNEAVMLETAASQNYQATSNLLQTEYFRAVQLFRDGSRRVRLYEKQSKLASVSLELVLKNFSTSLSDLTSVLRVRQQTLDYELKQVEAVADLNIASAWLRRLGNLERAGISLKQAE
jgi:outer membrane protein TolC